MSIEYVLNFPDFMGNRFFSERTRLFLNGICWRSSYQSKDNRQHSMEARKRWSKLIEAYYLIKSYRYNNISIKYMISNVSSMVSREFRYPFG